MTKWSLMVSWPSLLPGLVFLAAAAWLSVQQYRRTGARKAVLWLEALRWGIVLLLFLTLLQPELRRRTRPTATPEVVVLCDRSRSMQTEDVVVAGSNAISRAAWLEQRRAEKFWAPLEGRYTVRVQEFAAPRPHAKDATVEEGTDINGALESTLAGARNLRAAVLLTDGDWNLGVSPVAAASRLQAAGVPVFAVGVGSEKYLPDIALVNVAVPAYGLVGEQVFIPFTARSHLERDVRTRVQLIAGGGEAASKEIVIPAHGQVQDGVMWFPRRDGATALELKIPVQRDEVRADNNQQAFSVNIRRETLRVLVIDSVPRWEYRYLRNALSRDPVVEVQCLLFLPGLKSGGRDYLDRFPETRDKLSAYDVVFVGDVGMGENELTKEQAGLLKGLVEQQGSGLVFLPGRRGRQITLMDTELGSICPVLPDASKPNGILSVEPAALNLTRVGRGHLLTTLANNEEANELVWRTLPGFSWCAGVERARPGSEVLGVHESLNNAYGRLPLLVTRPAGNGKTLFLGTDSAWRWRRGVEDRYHYRFWGQVVRWMSYQRHRAHDEGFRLAFTPDHPAPGDTVTISATAFDALGMPLSDATVTLEVKNPKGLLARQVLNPVPGGWGVYQGQFAAGQGGTYRLRVSSGQQKRSMEAEVVVRGGTREEVGRPAQTDSLKEIAAITRGQYGDTAALAAFIHTLAAMPEPEPVERRVRVWSSPWWGLVLLLLLTAYWVGRKLSGLV